jgi:serine/threonine-protein kinase
MNDINTPDVAVSTLTRAANIYNSLRHPTLINLVEHKKINNGYILVFDWAPGECMNEHWTYDKYPKYTHEKSAFYRYIRLEREKLLNSLNDIFEFHRFIASKEYVAIDFYDGSVMYDFVTEKTTICDIDFYQKSPYINKMGRLFGSSRFMSPEEFTKDDIIDEITNVFTLGATAFVFLGGEKDRSYAKWRMGKALYDVALKAVSPERKNRYPSITEFINNWNSASLEK